MESTSEFLKHIPCDNCGSSDANSLYSDLHTHCFKCGVTVQPEGDGGGPKTTSRKPVANLIRDVEPQALDKRKLTQETCQKFGYGVATYNGQKVQVANYYSEDGHLIAQKVRTQGKDFFALGEIKDALPFGSKVWPKGGKKLIVTEGEIDALSVSQLNGNKYPVVSIGCGAGNQVRKYFVKHRDYFLGFDEVVLMLDNDEPGIEAAKVAAEILGPAKCKIAKLPLKDANEMLVAGRGGEVISAIWNAEKYKPEGIVELASLKDKVKEAPNMGLSWWSPQLTALTYGIRTGELIALGAGTGVGKSDLFAETIAHFAVSHGESVGVFSLEQAVTESAKRIAGKVASKPFHIPNAGWTEDQLDLAWDRLTAKGTIYLYDSFGINEWQAIKGKIEYLAHSGVRFFLLDHLTALVGTEEDERKALDKIMAEMGSMVKQLNITIIFISHLTTPEKGPSHEEGGQVSLRQFRGARSIGFWSSFAIGLERNQQAEDPEERHTTTVRILKDRYTGRATGSTFKLKYNSVTGRLLEKPEEPESNYFSEEAEPSDF